MALSTLQFILRSAHCQTTGRGVSFFSRGLQTQGNASLLDRGDAYFRRSREQWTPRMNNTPADTLVVKVKDFFSLDKVFKKRRTKIHRFRNHNPTSDASCALSKASFFLLPRHRTWPRSSTIASGISPSISWACCSTRIIAIPPSVRMTGMCGLPTRQHLLVQRSSGYFSC
jgi:hypothetical protein